MRKILLSIVFGCVSLFGVEWVSYERALELQKQSFKPIMVEVVRSDCRYCIAMQRDVFKDEAMSKWIAERFIAVKINLDSEKLPLNVTVTMTPSFYFVGKDYAILKSIPGSWSISDFKDLTKNIKGQ